MIFAAKPASPVRAPPGLPKPKVSASLRQAGSVRRAAKVAGVGGAFLERLADEGALVDLAVHAEGAERDLEQAAVGDEIGGGGDGGDLFGEVGDVALELGALLEGGLLPGLGALEEAPPGDAGQRDGGLEAHGAAHEAERMSRSRASRGSRQRSARIAW